MQTTTRRCECERTQQVYQWKNSSAEFPFKPDDALDTHRLANASAHLGDASLYATASDTPQHESSLIDYIPGEAAMPLTESDKFLQRELATPILDELYNVLHLFARKLSTNIDTLHAQIFKGRNIVLTEDPRFHLVRQERRVFIKPIPLCLLNHDFWTHYLTSDMQITPASPSSMHSHAADHLQSTSDSYRSMALGFIRSHAYLIQHQSDFQISKERGLLPADITWAKWSKYIKGFLLVHDDDVARRYRYGQLRLTRLNWAILIFRPKSAGKSLRFYHESPWSTLVFIRYAAVPLAFIFAGVSLVLSSMQVMLTVPDDSLLSSGISENGLRTVQLISWWFSIVTLLFAALSSVLLIFVPLLIIIYQVS